MNLLLVTDHTFLSFNSKIYDNFCFSRSFFNDYQGVFNSVKVLTRVLPVDRLPPGAMLSDGDGVDFLSIKNLHGLKWVLLADRVSNKRIQKAVFETDSVVVRVPSQLGWLAAQIAFHKNIPFMAEIIGDPKITIQNSGRGIQFWMLSQLEALRLKFVVKRACVVSYVSQKHLPDQYPVSPGTPYDHISSIRLDSSQITQKRCSIEKRQKYRILLVASLIPYKRHSDILRACKILSDKGFPVEVHFAGDGPLKDELQLLTRQYNLVENVVFHGHIADREVLNNLIDSCDLFVMSSSSEGLPRAMLEAMARGLPAIGSNASGVDELVRDSEQFEVGDSEGLASLLFRILQSPTLLTELSEHSIQVAKQYSSEVLSPKRIQLYRLLQNKSFSAST
jgi:glycosyltransferase involved in cell wall biosynthesis